MESIINNWVSIVVSLIVGQIFLTLWFSVFFGNKWAKAYDPSKSKVEHTKDIAGGIYAIGGLCTLLLSIGIQILHHQFAIDSFMSSITLAVLFSILLIVPIVAPGYLFLKKTTALMIVLGSQSGLAILISLVHYLL